MLLPESGIVNPHAAALQLQQAAHACQRWRSIATSLDQRVDQRHAAGGARRSQGHRI
jgi:hypothetical protein